MNKFLLALVFILASGPLSASTISSFLEMVRTKNLDIQSQKHIVNGALERSKGLNLPAPQVGVSQMRNLEGSFYGFEVQQSFPLSSKLFDDKKTRQNKYSLQRKESSFLSDSILFEARLAYVNYWASYQKMLLAVELRDWLKHHLKYAQSLVRSNSDMRIHSLEIEGSIGIYDNEISFLKTMLEAEKSKLRNIVYEASYDPEVPILDVIPELPTSALESRIAEIDFAKLQVATSNHEVAKNANAPNFFLKLRKLDRPMLRMANQEIMVGIDLPFLYFWQGRADNAEAFANKHVAEAKYKKSIVESDSLKESLKAQTRLIKDQFRNLNNISVPAADKRLRYLKNIAPRDMSGLESHHRIFHDAIELKTQLVDARTRYEELYMKWMILFGDSRNEKN